MNKTMIVAIVAVAIVAIAGVAGVTLYANQCLGSTTITIKATGADAVEQTATFELTVA